MSSVAPVTGAAALLRDAIERAGQQAQSIADDVASGAGVTPEFLSAVSELNQAKLSLKATALVAHTLDELAADLLSRPRR